MRADRDRAAREDVGSARPAAAGGAPGRRQPQAELERRFGELAGKLHRAGGLWVAWPKKSSGVATDLVEGRVRRAGLDGGLVDNKICAVDETWSGLRFVYRLKDR